MIPWKGGFVKITNTYAVVFYIQNPGMLTSIMIKSNGEQIVNKRLQIGLTNKGKYAKIITLRGSSPAKTVPK